MSVPTPLAANLLKVMLVDSNTTRSSELKQTLEDLGHVVFAVRPDPGLLATVVAQQPDMVVIDTESPDRDMIESMFVLSEHHPLPVVIFSEDDRESTIKEAIRSGVSGYIIKDTDISRVKSIMDVAIARFQAHQHLRNELQSVQGELTAERQIKRAKTLLMKHKQLSEAKAYASMRQLAMEKRQSLAEIAQQIVDVLG